MKPLPIYKRLAVLLLLVLLFSAYTVGRLTGALKPGKGETWKREFKSFLQMFGRAGRGLVAANLKGL